MHNSSSLFIFQIRILFIAPSLLWCSGAGTQADHWGMKMYTRDLKNALWQCTLGQEIKHHGTGGTEGALMLPVRIPFMVPRVM